MINARLGEHFISFSQELNKFNNTGALIFTFYYHMTLKLIKNLFIWCENVKILPPLHKVKMDVII